jgi:DNA-binding MltR family transcriptional regulator
MVGDQHSGGLKVADKANVGTCILRLAYPPVSEKEWDQSQKEFAQALKAMERLEGIVYVCSLDEGLELLLRTAMIDDESVDELMKDGQALQSFNSKLKLAYALGLLPEDVRADLHCLNKIRNYFAHEVGVTSFDKAPIRDLCGNLSTARARDGKVRTSREAHRSAVFESWLYLRYEIQRRRQEETSPQVSRLSRFEILQTAFRETFKKAPKTGGTESGSPPAAS